MRKYLSCCLLAVLGCAGGLEPEERESFELLYKGSPNDDYTLIDETLVFNIVAAEWLKEYPGVVPPVEVDLQYEPIEIVQTRADNVPHGTVVYGVADFDGTVTHIYIVDVLRNDFALLVLAHELAHAFEFAAGHPDDMHATPEVWGENGIVSNSVEKAKIEGAILGQPIKSVTWLSTSD